MFHIADGKDIKAGKVTDVYFQRTLEVLKAKGIDKHVRGEVRARVLPEGWPWAVLAGIEEVAELAKGLAIDIESMPEGTVFQAEEPVMTISGMYTRFGIFETAFLGLVCQATGIATKAARCRISAGERGLYSFGARRMHPAIAPMIERSAFIGGCDGVAAVESAELIGEQPMGTMPHAFIIVIGDPAEAYKAFDEVVPQDIRRVALIDTFEDEKFGALTAANALKDRLFAVRLDTPGSRRGDFAKIIEEVRWELDLRGFDKVKIFASGGLNEYSIPEINRFVDSYGVGTTISNAPVVDFAFDIVEVEGEPFAKRGKMSGAKQVYRCGSCGDDYLVPAGQAEIECSCGGTGNPLLRLLIRGGETVGELPVPRVIREYVLQQIEEMGLEID